jgi:hypothetical protein
VRKHRKGERSVLALRLHAIPDTAAGHSTGAQPSQAHSSSFAGKRSSNSLRQTLRFQAIQSSERDLTIFLQLQKGQASQCCCEWGRTVTGSALSPDAAQPFLATAKFRRHEHGHCMYEHIGQRQHRPDSETDGKPTFYGSTSATNRVMTSVCRA